MPDTLVELAVWSYGASVCFVWGWMLAETGPPRRDQVAWLLLGVLWPLMFGYGFLWGSPSRRSWWCRLTSHRWRPVVTGYRLVDGERLTGRQCERCWQTVRDG